MDEGAPAFASELEKFLKFGTATTVQPNCLTPLGELPASFRSEIAKGISTGWQCLDMYLQGLRPGEVTVVTADTGAGKTTFCLQLLVNAAMQGMPVWVNSWEMRPETVLRKISSIILRKPMKYTTFTSEDSERLDTWAKKFRLYVNQDTIGTSVDSLAAQLVAAKKLGIGVVLLDHLDYLVNFRREKVHEAIDETVKRLHELSFALQMHFLLVCHPRQTMTGTEEVGMHSLKGSSSIKQYADNILIMHRCSRTDPNADPNKVKIRVTKNRMFGIEGTTYLFYAPLWDGYQQLNEDNKYEDEGSRDDDRS